MRWKILEYVKQPTFFVYFICVKNMSLRSLMKMSTKFDGLELCITWRTLSFLIKKPRKLLCFVTLNTGLGKVNHT